MARVVASVVVAVFLQLTASCSLVGLCIGAATPQTRTVVRFDANAPIPEGCAPETRPVALVPAGDARSLSCREGNHALAGFFVGGEGGATLHQGVLWLGEGTLLLGLNL